MTTKTDLLKAKENRTSLYRMKTKSKESFWLEVNYYSKNMIDERMAHKYRSVIESASQMILS